jgi:hypothetical protein
MKQGFLLIFILMSFGAEAQIKKKLTFSVSGGAALPIGIFAKKDVEAAAIYDPDRVPPAVASIAKSKSGFAKTGYYYQAELSYLLSQHLFAFVRTGTSVNPISVSEMDAFFSSLNGLEQRFSHEDNVLFSVTPGLGYFINKESWKFSFGMFAGYGRVKYPYYENRFVFTQSDIIWAHSGARPDLSSWVSGGMMKTEYKIKKCSIGLEVLFQRANFDYEIYPKTIPGGSQSETFSDTLKSRILQAGLTFGYTLGLIEKRP